MSDSKGEIASLSAEALPYNVEKGAMIETKSFSTEEGELQAKLGRPAVLGIAYLTVTTWSAYSTASATALVAGGLNVFFWGLLICVVCNLAGAASLAEPGSLSPHGSQPIWCFIMAPSRSKRIISYYTNWFIFLGFLLIVVTGCCLCAQMVLAMAQMSNPTFEIKTFHIPLVMNGFTLYCFLVGTFGSKIIAKANTFSLIWNICGFLLMSIFILAQSRGHYNTPKEAFVDVVNESGWPSSFVPWVTSLSQAALSTTAFDGVAHFSDEMYKPHRDVPFGMMSAIGLNGIVGLLYAVIFVFCLPPDATSLLSTPTGFPFGQFLLDLAGGSAVGGIFLILVLFVPFLLTIADGFMATARIARLFSHQRGLPLMFAKVNTRLDTPLNANIMVTVIAMGIAWIYIGSTAGFLAFMSAPTVVLGWSYAMVAATMLFHGRPVLGSKTPFSLGPILGPVSNIVTIIFNLLITVFLCLPSSYPVSQTTMNYTSVLLAATLVAPLICWIMYAGKHYTGPQPVAC